ncbi:MAG: nitroreductase family protein [Deltaproteobacteria bacterium]|jgi:nitroreductase|nr:nitroreductase family protein [Deltaproteobacteria bacterium]
MAEEDGEARRRRVDDLPDPATLDLESIGEDLPLLEGLRTTRAIRRLRPDPVPRALIRKVCEAGTFAPSGGNEQPWIFVAVDDPERRAWIADRYRPVFQGYATPILERDDLPEAARRNVEAALHLAEHLHEAPVLLFIAGRRRRGEPWGQALYPCAQNVLLACRAVGLGASFTNLHRSFQDECDRMLGLAQGSESAVMIPIGWPLGRYGRPPRVSVDEKLFFNRVDAAAG